MLLLPCAFAPLTTGLKPAGEGFFKVVWQASKKKKKKKSVVLQLFLVCKCLFLLCSDSIFPRLSSDFFISAEVGQTHLYVQEGGLNCI